jgi:hypothetical protein
MFSAKKSANQFHGCCEQKQNNIQVPFTVLLLPAEDLNAHLKVSSSRFPSLKCH